MKNEVNTNSRGYEIEIKDLLARLFDKWIIILIFLLIGAAIGGLIGVNKNKNRESRIVTQEDVDNARQNLSEERAEQIEYLYRQYVSYKDYSKSLEEYLAASLYSGDEFADSIILTSVYYIDFSALSGANQVLELLSLDMEDCEKIASILGMDSINLDDIYRRVNVSGINGASTVNINLPKDEKNSYVVVDKRSEKDYDHLLQIWAIADTKEQAEEITKVVEESFDRSLEGLQKIDKGISLTLIGQKYSADVYDFLNGRQSDLTADLYDANYQIFRLQDETINALNSSEKNYFDTLKARDEQKVVSSSSVSLKKLVLLGAVIGLIIGCVLVILQYLLNGRLKTAKELKERFAVEVPSTIWQKQKRFHLFGCLIRKLEGADFSDEAINRKMAASDMVIKLEKSDFHSVCLLCDQITDVEKTLAQEIAAGIEEKGKDLRLQMLNPLASVGELETFSAADAVILVTQLKKTRLNVVNKWTQLCTRYEIPVAGAIALEEC